jgi:hypothetical protein
MRCGFRLLGKRRRAVGRVSQFWSRKNSLLAGARQLDALDLAFVAKMRVVGERLSIVHLRTPANKSIARFVLV